MNRTAVFASLVVIVASAASATAQTTSPYAGQQQRTIKALSDQEIGDLLEGRGMGLAKAAESTRIRDRFTSCNWPNNSNSRTHNVRQPTCYIPRCANRPYRLAGRSSRPSGPSTEHSRMVESSRQRCAPNWMR